MEDIQNKEDILTSDQLRITKDTKEVVFAGGLIRMWIQTDVTWLDKANHIYNEIYHKMVWFCGILIFNRYYKAKHTILDGAITRTGFGGSYEKRP